VLFLHDWGVTTQRRGAHLAKQVKRVGKHCSVWI